VAAGLELIQNSKATRTSHQGEFVCSRCVYEVILASYSCTELWLLGHDI
jgi:hypothetical protein